MSEIASGVGKHVTESKQIISLDGEERRLAGIKRHAMIKFERSRSLVEEATAKRLLGHLTPLEQKAIQRVLSDHFVSQQEFAKRYSGSRQSLANAEKKGLSKLRRLLDGDTSLIRQRVRVMEQLGENPKQKLEELIIKHGGEGTARLFGVSRATIQNIKRELGARGRHVREGTQREKALGKLGENPRLNLIELTGKMTDSELAEYLDVSLSVARGIRRELGVSKRKEKGELPTKKRIISKDKQKKRTETVRDKRIRFIARSGNTVDEISETLGISKYEVESRMDALGIPQDPAEREIYYNDLVSDKIDDL